MEVYTNSADRKVFLNTPVSPIVDSLEVTLRDDTGSLLHTFTTAELEDTDLYSVTVPFHFVNYERLMVVLWKFDYIEAGETYSIEMDVPFNVVQPILPLAEVKALLNTTDDVEARAVEKTVRHIIYAHTGQSFGLFVGTKKIQGTGGPNLQLPYRLLEISKVNGLNVSPARYLISRSGWYLTTPEFGVPGIKADYYGLHYINGVVENPNGVSLDGFKRGWEYVIEGKWGWREVPESVQEAARLLINDYACQDTVYRDRYLNSVAATDWKLSFNSGAFQYTGNVRADQLLSNYVLKRGWAVV